MKTVSNTVAYLSLALNFGYIILTIYILNHYSSFKEAKERFEELLPFPHGITVILLILLSIYSLIVLARKQTVLPKILAFLQVFFIIMYIWQFL